MKSGDESILLRLVVDRDADPITGTLTRPGEPPMLFTGWLGLTNAIETVRGREAQAIAKPPHTGDEQPGVAPS